MLFRAAALTALQIRVPGPDHVLVEIVLQDGVGLFQHLLPAGGEHRLAVIVQHLLGVPLLAPADLHDRLFDRSDQSRVLTSLRPEDLLFHHRDIDHMQMVVVDILSQCLGHGPVPLIRVHDGGENELLASDDLYRGFIGVGIELLGKFIAAVVVEVGGVYVEDQLTEFRGVRLLAPGGDDLLLFQFFEHVFVGAGWFLEMNIERGTLRDDIRVGVDFLLPFVVGLSAFDGVALFQIAISGDGAIDPVVSCHGQRLLFFGLRPV